MTVEIGALLLLGNLLTKKKKYEHHCKPLAPLLRSVSKMLRLNLRKWYKYR